MNTGVFSIIMKSQIAKLTTNILEGVLKLLVLKEYYVVLLDDNERINISLMIKNFVKIQMTTPFPASEQNMKMM